MRSASTLSTAESLDEAIASVLGEVGETFGAGRGPADLTVIFASSHHADTLPRLARALLDRGLTRHVLGCTGETIVGDGREVEEGPALSAWSVELPGAELTPVRVADDRRDAIGELRCRPDQGRTMLLLGDPFSFDAGPWLKKLDAEAPGFQVLGGMASGSQAPRGNRLLIDDQVHDDGAVGFLLGGAIRVRTLVSQGCRPIGRPYLVTRAERNLIRELGRRPALEALRDLFEALPADDQERVQSGLHIGWVINEYQEAFGRGDFLVRNVMGADDQGGIAITDIVRVGQTVQFHVRDAESADDDLRTLVDAARAAAGPSTEVVGALLFSCNGRGTRLFDRPDHDVSAIRDAVGPVPVVGFFAMGEFGPVGGQNFVHGYTASVVVFESTAT